MKKIGECFQKNKYEPLSREFLLKRYKQMYSYDEDPTEIEARKNEENWEMFSQK